MEYGDAAKILGGGLGAFAGAMLTRLGWRKAKRGRDDGGPISREEWHELSQSVHKLIWGLQELKDDVNKQGGLVEKGSERLSALIAEVAYVRARLETLGEHCDHCPGHGRQR